MALSNSQYDEIMRSYQQDDIIKRRELKARVDVIYKKVPVVKEIDKEIASMSASHAKMRIRGDKDAVKKLKERLNDLKLQKEALLFDNGFTPDDMKIQYNCNLCNDTGYIDGKKCKCFNRKEIDMLYRQSNLNEILEKENFDTFSFEWYDNTTSDNGRSCLENARAAATACLEMASCFENEKRNLLLTGPAGTGKTFLTHCIAKKLLDECYSVIYLSATELFNVLSKHHFEDEKNPEDELMYHHIFDCDLLIIDDLGTEVINNFTISSLFSCINLRASNGRSVVISTNFNMEQINDRYSERISSRLISNYKILELSGEDIRIKKLIANRRRIYE